MRGVRAKQLRRTAEKATVGQERVAYQDWHPPVYSEHDLGHQVVTVKSQKGVPARLAQSTRAVYKNLKKLYKKLDKSNSL